MFHHRCILALLERILLEVRAIRFYLIHRPTAIRITFEGVTMPVQMKVGQTVSANAAESDAQGNSVAISDPTALQWSSSDTTLVSASAVDNSGGTVFTAHAAGTVTVTVTDPANGLTVSDTITVEAAAPVATAIQIEFGTPQ